MLASAPPGLTVGIAPKLGLWGGAPTQLWLHLRLGLRLPLRLWLRLRFGKATRLRGRAIGAIHGLMLFAGFVQLAQGLVTLGIVAALLRGRSDADGRLPGQQLTLRRRLHRNWCLQDGPGLLPRQVTQGVLPLFGCGRCAAGRGEFPALKLGWQPGGWHGHA